jgi:hypothetical protein
MKGGVVFERAHVQGNRPKHVAQWAVAVVDDTSKVQTAGSVFQVREDEPEPRVGGELHRMP